MKHMSSRLDKDTDNTAKHIVKVPRWVVFLFISVLLRLLFVHAYPYYAHQHDSSYIEGEWGHASYIYEVAEEGFDQLSHNPMNRWSFYNPPLHYWLAALVFNLFRSQGFDNAWAMERVQYLTLSYTVLASLLGVWILHQLGLRKEGHDRAASAWCVLPSMIILSGQLSPDALLLLLSLGVISATLSWYKSPSYLLALLVGVLSGLCVMTKFSGFITLIFPGMAMFASSVINKPKLTNQKIISYSLIALLLTVVIGGWWHIAMLVMNQMPIGYMQKASLLDPQYIGYHSILERLTIPSGALELPFIVLGKGSPTVVDSNIVLTELKYIAFDEIVSADAHLIKLGWFLLFATSFLFLVKVVSLIFWLLKEPKILKSNDNSRVQMHQQVFAAIGIVIYILAAIYLAMKEPFTCSMSFRYIIPVAALSACFIGSGMRGILLKRITCMSTIALIVSQVLFYLELIKLGV